MAWSLPQLPHLGQVHTVAIHGAESTGKTSLLQALQQRLQTHGILHAVVPETLRMWCDTQQRLPRPDEQGGIARAHAQAIVDAAQNLQLRRATQTPTAASTAVLLVDTTPLTTALYSQYHFGDAQGLEPALAFERGFDQRLLLGLDIPWVADPGVRDGPEHRNAFDTLLRHTLNTAGLAHQIIYGLQERRTQAAWMALQNGLEQRLQSQPRPKSTWRAACECCADPSCEWALFTGLGKQA